VTHTLTKEFRFEAGHTLSRDIEREGSLRLHGHSYRAVVAISGQPDAATGMVVDLGKVAQALDRLKGDLDHRFLNEVADLGPATLENLARFIFDRLKAEFSGLAHVTVARDSLGDSCRYEGARP